MVISTLNMMVKNTHKLAEAFAGLKKRNGAFCGAPLCVGLLVLTGFLMATCRVAIAFGKFWRVF